MNYESKHGPIPLGANRWRMRVWAPAAGRVWLQRLDPEESLLAMVRDDEGYWETEIADAPPGTRYRYKLEGDPASEGIWPDPASRRQPEGVHGPSALPEFDFDWTATGWNGLALEDYILYELHVGTYTSQSDFDAIIAHLPELVELGVTAIEIMPVAQFPDGRNWGYDGVYPFAVNERYGGIAGLKRLVDACHAHGLAAVLDVVYNHFGPEGAYFSKYGPWFTERHTTPWGAAINFDDADNEPVRRFFIENARYWIEEFRFDALRLDAIHAIKDDSPRPFLAELTEAVHALIEPLRRPIVLFAESDLNDCRVVESRDCEGFGFDVQWNDDFHHSLHTLLTGERSGYYADFGEALCMVKAWQEGYVYTGQYSPCRGTPHGMPSGHLPAHRFLICCQNHDQVGNRLLGERLSALVDFDRLKLAAATVLLSPFIPMLFMGEEYGETAPFLYFSSHSDPELVAAVRAGRREEFAHFGWKGEVPDPCSDETFEKSKLNHYLKRQGRHAVLLSFYRELIRLRTSLPALRCLNKDCMEVSGPHAETLIAVRRWHQRHHAWLLLNFSPSPRPVPPLPAGFDWQVRLDSADPEWGGTAANNLFSRDGHANVTLQPWSAVLLDAEA